MNKKIISIIVTALTIIGATFFIDKKQQYTDYTIINANPNRSLVATPDTNPETMPIFGTWVWEKIVMNDGTIIIPNQTGIFTITFTNDGRVSGTTDCNDFGGNYTQTSPREIAFATFASTKKFCTGSQDSLFTSAIMNTDHYAVSSNTLTLTLKQSIGEIYFKRQ